MQLLSKLNALLPLLKELFLWWNIHRAAKNKFEKECLQQQIKDQKNDLQISSQPYFPWGDLLERMFKGQP